MEASRPHRGRLTIRGIRGHPDVSARAAWLASWPDERRAHHRSTLTDDRPAGGTLRTKLEARDGARAPRVGGPGGGDPRLGGVAGTGGPPDPVVRRPAGRGDPRAFVGLAPPPGARPGRARGGGGTLPGPVAAMEGAAVGE